MKINVYTIEKKKSDAFSTIIENQKKMINRFAKIEEISIYNKKISMAQNQEVKIAQESYTKAFIPYLNGSNIALHPAGIELDSFEFSKKFDNIQTLNFFIGGAFGFDADFLKRCDSVVSLSRLTYSHKIAKLILFEQIYRALTIKNNHPYHK